MPGERIEEEPSAAIAARLKRVVGLLLHRVPQRAADVGTVEGSQQFVDDGRVNAAVSVIAEPVDDRAEHLEGLSGECQDAEVTACAILAHALADLLEYGGIH